MIGDLLLIVSIVSVVYGISMIIFVATQLNEDDEL